MYTYTQHSWLNTHGILGIVGVFLRYIFKGKEKEREAIQIWGRESIRFKQREVEDRSHISLNLKVINFKINLFFHYRERKKVAVNYTMTHHSFEDAS